MSDYKKVSRCKECGEIYPKGIPYICRKCGVTIGTPTPMIFQALGHGPVTLTDWKDFSLDGVTEYTAFVFEF